MSTVRDRRLQSDHERLVRLVAAHKEKIAIETARGNPPETYLLLMGLNQIPFAKPIIYT